MVQQVERDGELLVDAVMGFSRVPLAVNHVPIRCKTEGVFQYCVSYR